MQLVGNAEPRAATAPKAPNERTLVAKDRQLTVYPNPSSEGSLQLRLSGTSWGARVQITDTKGQVVYRGVHDPGQVQLGPRFPRGMYVVRVTDARGTLTQKLLIE